MAKQSGIFFIGNGQGMTRIARTNDLNKRMSEWQAASPFALKVVGSITTREVRGHTARWLTPSQDTRLAEASEADVFNGLRRHFSAMRVSGDWYMINEQTLLDMPIQKPHTPPNFAALASKSRLVWEAVDYALDRVPGAYMFSAKDEGERMDLLYDNIVKWLAKRGKGNIAVILQFDQEFKFLSRLAGDVGECEFGPRGTDLFDWQVSWLVLQGKAVFVAALENPSICHILRDPSFCGYSFAYDATCEIIQGTLWEGGEYFYELQSRCCSGARPEDFTGWDAARVIAQSDFSKGATHSQK